MRKYLIFFVLSVCLYALHFYATRHGIYGDGNGYFSLAHTIFFQPKLDFRPVYGYLSAFRGASYTFSRVFWNTSPTVTGVLNCPWIIGTAYFWLPSFFIVRLLSFMPGTHIGEFSFLYEFGCGITGILLVLAGLYLLESTVRVEFGVKLSSVLINALFFGTQLFYYATLEPALAHQASFFLICLILFIVNKHANLFTVSVLGLSSGLLMITRIGEVVLIALPVGIYMRRVLKGNNRFHYLFLFGAAFIAGILPQLLLQKALYGTYAYNPYLHAEKGVFHFLYLSSLWNHLFAAGGGFFLWSPVFLLAAYGMYLGIKSRRIAMFYVYVLSLFIYYIFIASWELVPPSGFGNRFFLSAIPFLSFGLAYLLRQYKRAAAYIIIVAIVWNLLLVGQFFLDSDRMVKRRGLNIGNLLMGQISVPLQRARAIHF